MSAIDFQLLDEEKIDDSIIKRDFIKIQHQSRSKVHNGISIIKIYFGENHKFIRFGHRYLEFDMKFKKTDITTFVNFDVIRLVNNAFSYIIGDARISNSSGFEIEQNKFCGPISTIMRLVTQKDGDLSTYFDIIDQRSTESIILH